MSVFIHSLGYVSGWRLCHYIIIEIIVYPIADLLVLHLIFMQKYVYIPVCTTNDSGLSVEYRHKEPFLMIFIEWRLIETTLRLQFKRYKN